MPGIRTFLTTLLILAIAGCSSGSKTVRPLNKAAVLPAVDPALSAHENLERLAAAELQQPPPRAPEPATGYGVVTPPIPPGVEPEVLALRSATDERAFMTMDEALKSLQDSDAISLKHAPTESAAPGDEEREEALRAYVRGRNAALEGKQMVATFELRKALELDPTSPAILRELADVYAQANDRARAAEMYERLLLISPDDAQAMFTLALGAANRRDFPRAAALIGRRRLADKPFDHDPAADLLADYTLAIALREMGYDRAAIEAAAASMSLPDGLRQSSEYLTQLGSVYRQRGEMWRSIGDARCRLGEYSEALEAYAVSASLPTPDPTALHPRVVYANLCLGRVFNAQREMLGAIRSEPQNGASVADRDVHLCSYLFEHGQPVDLLAQAIAEKYRSSPDDASLLRAAAALLPPDQSRELLRVFIARRPRDLDVVSSLLIWMDQAGIRPGAAGFVASLAQDNPDLADAYADRLLRAMARPTDAIRELRQRRGSSYGPPSQILVEARLLASMGALGEAWTLVEHARRQSPDDAALAVMHVHLAAALNEPALLEQAITQAEPFGNIHTWTECARALRTIGRNAHAVEFARRAADAVRQSPSTATQEATDAMVEYAWSCAAQAAALGSGGSAASSSEARQFAQLAKQAAEEAAQLAPAADEPFEILLAIHGPGGVMVDGRSYAAAARRLFEANPQSRLYSRLAAQESIGQKRYEQALERLVNLYDTDAADVQSLALAVAAWERWERLDTAEQWLDQRLDARPGDPSLLEQWVRVKLLQDDSATAMQRLQSIVQADPDDANARSLLENVYRVRGSFIDAVTLGEQRLQARPQAPGREVALAELYMGAGRSEDAVTHLRWVRDHAGQAGADQLHSAIVICGRLDDSVDGRNDLLLELVQVTIDRHPRSPLQVYGYGLRALAAEGQEDTEAFQELAARAARDSVAARTASPPGSNGSVIIGAQSPASDVQPWRDFAQALIDDGHPRAAAGVLRARLRHTLKDDARQTLSLAMTIFACDAASGSPSASPPTTRVADTLALIKELHEQHAFPDLPGAEGRLSLFEIHSEVSQTYSIIGDQAGAEELLREALSTEPASLEPEGLKEAYAQAMNNLGYMRVDAGHDDAETVAWLERAYALVPEDANILDSIGWLRYKQGRLTATVGQVPAVPEAPGLPGPDGQNAAAPGSAPAPQGAAAPAQDEPGAVEFIRRAIDAAEEPSAEVYDHLGDALWRLGDQNSAIEAWQRVISLLEGSASAMNRQEMLRLYRQTQLLRWGLLVTDPEALYDREFGVILERVRQKLEAVTNADPADRPQVAPTFAEQRDRLGG